MQLPLLFMKDKANHVVVWLCYKLYNVKVKLVGIEADHGK